MELGEALISLLFPPRCLFCSQILGSDDLFCPGCRHKFPEITESCPNCAGALGNGSDVECKYCGSYPFSFRGLRAVARYQGEWRKVIHRFKYGRERYLARPLARLMFEKFVGWNGLDADLFVPVPLHPRRQAERGFNQSYILARELARLAGKPCRMVLERCVDTPSQTGLNRQERLHNLQGAFSLRSPLGAAQTVLVVDDVFTTGATAEATSSILLQNGARHVFISVAGR